MFVSIQNQTDYQWTDEDISTFRRDWPHEDLSEAMSKYIPIKLNGTTFSGHPTATTLGNTLRSICYVLFYLHMADIPVECCKYFASGDDVNIFVSDKHFDLLVSTILKYTNRTNTSIPGTLG